MRTSDPGRPAWPELDFGKWRDSGATLQLWTQIVGKLRLALSPWLNHGWQVPLYVSARGLASSAMHDVPPPQWRWRQRMAMAMAMAMATYCAVAISDAS